MRIVLTAAASLLVLAACNKAEAPKPVPSTPTAGEMGQDDPSVPFSPPTPGAAHTYEAVSKTAMSITGNLTLAPTAQTGPNMPPGAIFTFAKGMAITATLMPGGAEQGAPPFDFKSAFPSQRPLNIGKIEMYSVETEKPGPGSKTGSICDKTGFVATYLDDGGTPDAADDLLMLAAFTSDDWPPSKPDAALCATYTYMPSTK
jgi:hypothetical protein